MSRVEPTSKETATPAVEQPLTRREALRKGSSRRLVPSYDLIPFPFCFLAFCIIDRAVGRLSNPPQYEMGVVYSAHGLGGGRGGAVITINGKKEKIYHISLSPLVITLGAESIDIRSYWGPAEPEGFDLREKRRALAKHFEAGSVSLTGLSRHPDPKERGIGPELAACLDGELVFADGHKVRVFCLRRPHAPQEEGVVFQEAMREAARREMADGPAREEPLNPSMAASREFSRGKLRCSSGFKDIWVEDTHYDLRTRPKARLCIQYLCENSAFDPATARYLVDEIDPFVRDRGDYPRAAEIKIQHYFHSQDGKLPHLCRQLIGVVHGEGRYFLKVE